MEPNIQGLMTEIEQEKCMAWIRKKWTKNRETCDICQYGDWTLAQNFVTPIIVHQDRATHTQCSYPQIMIVCNHCGNTKYFNKMIFAEFLQS